MHDLMTLDTVIDALRTEQIARWEAGDRVLLEKLLEGHPRLERDTLLDLLCAEWLLREEFGETPTADEYVARFPDLADDVRRLFAVHSTIDRLATQADLSTLSLSGGSRRDRTSMAGTTLGPYDLLEEIGRGGMGIVYLARHQRDGARTANEKARLAAEALQRENAEVQRQSKRAYDLLTLMATAIDDIAITARAVDGKGSPGESLFKLGLSYAKTAEKLQENNDMPPEDRDRLAQQYAASAVRLLGCAESAGYFAPSTGRTRRDLEANADLKILAGRNDFKKLVERLSK